MHKTFSFQYGSKSDHLARSEAFAKYKEFKRDFPNALIELEQLDCGHWYIKMHKSEWEKEAFVKRKWSDQLGQFLTV